MIPTSAGRKKRIVVVGGGTGTHTVLRGLKQYADQIDIAAIVSMADSGGSTGRLRDEFGQLPIGDVRNALTALADTDSTHAELLRTLFLYRFEKGIGLSGHNFGNLFLTALIDIFGNAEEAIAAAGMILRVVGEVVPVTTDNVQLVAHYDDGMVIEGEALIDVPALSRFDRTVTQVALTPRAQITKRAREIIVNADLVVLGPGDLYTSIIPNGLVEGFVEALALNKGTFVYVCNLMTRPGQTHAMSATAHLKEIIRYFQREPDRMLINGIPFTSALLEKYALEREYPVINDCEPDDPRVQIFPLIIDGASEKGESTGVVHTLVRHDSLRLAEALLSIK